LALLVGVLALCAVRRTQVLGALGLGALLFGNAIVALNTRVVSWYGEKRGPSNGPVVYWGTVAGYGLLGAVILASEALFAPIPRAPSASLSSFTGAASGPARTG
jgi:hypothetical protein